ncbi:MAG: PQQ-dependent sugar dehydrogenase [Parasphingorhabdus sp.]|uniref:PQQ-dependent sugar dehydrogenase n=1 Tax=Parasphingorhabdus sp. TaxID=2709688 RepID=UPI0032972A45
MRSSLFAIASLLLSGCGGGSKTSSSVQLPPSANVRPQISTIAAQQIAENQSAVLTVQASDADGDQLSFSVSGEDADDFVINSSGALSFRVVPNFELPTDADMNNVYNVVVTASDGSLTASSNATITVENDREGILVRRLATGLNDVTVISTIPSQAKVFVAERGGNVYEMDTVDGTRSLDRTILNVNTAGEGGLLGLVVDPSFTANNTYWTFVTSARSGPFARSGSDISIRKINRQRPESLLGSGVQLEIPHDSDINYGGWLGFDPENNLYVMVGDAGEIGNAQDPNSKLGKVLRLRPNPDPFAGAAPALFLVPQGNPYAGGGGDRFVYTLGLQDPKYGALFGDGVYFSDRGSSVAEEINFMAHNLGGVNFGWPFFEGSTPSTGSTTETLTASVTEYPRGGGDREGNSVVAGAIYSGPIVSLQSKYIFADKGSGKIWAIGLNDLTGGETVPSSKYELLNTDFEPDAGSVDTIVAIGTDRENNLIIADSDGEIFVVEPSGF